MATRTWWSNRLAVSAGVFIAAAVAFAFAHSRLGVWSMDDAAITYAYSISLADRGSLSPLPESMPVEGYSNPLLFLLAALLRLLHLFDPITTHTKIELVAFALMAVLVHELLQARLAKVHALIGTAIFVTLELLTPSTWLWYSSGLENVIVSLALITLLFTVDRVARKGTFNPAGIGILGFLVALVRPEAPVYVAAFYLALLVLARPADREMRAHLLRLVVAGAITAGLYVGFLVWRHATYGVWLPNTYYAKLDGGPTVFANITGYVVPVIFPYGSSLLFALAPVALAFMAPHRTFAKVLGIFALASLVMPVVGGNDAMGEHRFATPFFAMSHVAVASLVGAVLAMRSTILEQTTRRLLIAIAVLPVGAFALAGLVAERPSPGIVTPARVLELHGVRRMQHQRRLGLIDPVMVAPDAGGTLLFGSVQYIDNGYLTDFQMAHMSRDLRVMTQYQTVERIADLADTNPSWSTFDRTLVGSQFLAPRDQHMFARRDLVELAAPPTSDPFYDQHGVRLYVSPDNVLVAAPQGLVRIELALGWTDSKALDDLSLFGSITGDDDTISLTPYGDLETVPASGLQRKALLLRAPAQPGRHDVIVELRRKGETEWTRTLLQIEVVAPDHMQPAVDALVNEPAAPPELVMRRFAWLREQSIPRLAQRTLRTLQAQLVTAYHTHARRAGRLVRKLTWDARLAALTDEVPAAVRAAEQAVIERMMKASTCDGPDLARKALCIGRRVDLLRRYGYFGVVKRMPAVRSALSSVENGISKLDVSQQYVALVGLNLAMPENVAVQKKLVRARDHFAKQPGWPALGL